MATVICSAFARVCYGKLPPARRSRGGVIVVLETSLLVLTVNT